ncbi:phosphopantothenoylcysteine decarboxylase / phosphopantothenate--cysteine ligase [Melghirimyces thermohalophilus]|uniref:Coenzyme A biosynthesis bifunctional protein CoaBC n=1 Tax=Melghirimyces thermohalophilus TaxID=1236220 RepID=A0A1G6HUE2_9BACL|nr:bifunctional phosphopantothenoylcysteine decarboxylase/phosphopantothenate--cysteine ligase CoaBC [Melghirimyces thermohalophilus]SDB97909.1 phosphopantothenoylcysteine decarboxylase / phosphopantothenate--cysteine ligase [Melghirimyces thermohalophilus]
MKGKRIVLGVTGGIAAYKAAGLVSQWTQRGADVRVIMTQSATRFITPLTFQTLSRNHVAIDTFDEQDPAVVNHIDLADHADLFVIAPATANIIGKIAHGLGDDMLSTTVLATQAPVLFAPAMNVHMYEHPIVRDNIHHLMQKGFRFVDPASGQLACGYVGKGRLADPEAITAAVEEILQEAPGALRGKRVVVTAGPTREPLDPVRYLTNRSSGKMGYALAEAAVRAGAETVLVSGPVGLTVPAGVRRVDVTTAEEMFEAVMKELPSSDIVIKAAAVADYTPMQKANRKIKKSGDQMALELKKTRDIAEEVGKRKDGQFLVGFAAETDHVSDHAIDKLHRKRMDLVVANDVSQAGAGFDGETNIVTVYDDQGEVLRLPQMSKTEVARRLMGLIGERVR